MKVISHVNRLKNINSFVHSGVNLSINLLSLSIIAHI